MSVPNQRRYAESRRRTRPERTVEEEQKLVKEGLALHRAYHAGHYAPRPGAKLRHKPIPVEAKAHLLAFLAGQPLHVGGTIPRPILASPNRVRLVLSASMGFATDQAHSAIARMRARGSQPEWTTIRRVPQDVSELLLRLIERCKRMGIPKMYRPGLILCYLELVEGVEFDGELKNVG